MASWRVGDRGRGWASVWVLHDSRLITVLSPHNTVHQMKPFWSVAVATMPAYIFVATDRK
jgi:hypothetical protein